MFVTATAASLTVWKKQTRSGRESNLTSLLNGKVKRLLDSMKGTEETTSSAFSDILHYDEHSKQRKEHEVNLFSSNWYLYGLKWQSKAKMQ